MNIILIVGTLITLRLVFDKLFISSYKVNKSGLTQAQIDSINSIK